MMFTGIIEEIGTISRIEPGSNSCRIEVMASKVLDDVRAGTVCCKRGVFNRNRIRPPAFYGRRNGRDIAKDQSEEQRNGSRVNLERALRLGDRLGGHLVQGHVDGVGMIAEQQKLDIATILRIKTEPGCFII
jgi:riboflavin synthase